ncbi:hypothetical protein PVK06_041802 [Gossypium arboreum]|uniref:Uncharacterized protein n=1 Tax=Gossypium arboreum TaxID=29729 RepID=A0ABR0N983_GOSAR|nr:hypothetical protein PVK06_041802 [Gossypium arboreum]
MSRFDWQTKLVILSSSSALNFSTEPEKKNTQVDEIERVEKVVCCKRIIPKNCVWMMIWFSCDPWAVER